MRGSDSPFGFNRNCVALSGFSTLDQLLGAPTTELSQLPFQTLEFLHLLSLFQMVVQDHKGRWSKSRFIRAVILLFLTVASVNLTWAISNFSFHFDSFISLSNISPPPDTSHTSYDGPHIFYKENLTIIKQVLKSDTGFYARMDTLTTSFKGRHITCHVNDSLKFTTTIKKSLKNEPSTYPAPEKLIAISDIEGNFIALRNFLVNNGVMNTDYQWTFGKGHLVLLGDFFDRGLNVTECLWLIYHLEQEALKCGGYVHFILGNHEIMNMNNDLRYVRNKYIENAMLIKEPYNLWYTPDTELGRWLLTKNIAEKIGDYLFMHGGLSKEMFSCKPTMQSINAEARKYYYRADEAMVSSDTCLAYTYSGDFSPFWYRGYINKTMDEQVLNSIEKHFNVNRIVVGHSIVEDVSYFYNKKVIGIDTHHAKGDSEGLFVEDGREYRIDGAGMRYPIN